MSSASGRSSPSEAPSIDELLEREAGTMILSPYMAV